MELSLQPWADPRLRGDDGCGESLQSLPTSLSLKRVVDGRLSREGTPKWSRGHDGEWARAVTWIPAMDFWVAVVIVKRAHRTTKTVIPGRVSGIEISVGA